ncbi:MAG: hypothetical protein N3D14_00175 [Aquificaceae bacterium]|nr:hypothetical protein [Aquificaceae bacterium]MCX8163796.1 hypothetical protein [Aquificaceae bacterium]
MEELRERLKRIEKLSLDPFKVEPLRKEMEELLAMVPSMGKDDLIELKTFLDKLKERLEENYALCFGWMEEVFQRGFRRQV